MRQARLYSFYLRHIPKNTFQPFYNSCMLSLCIHSSYLHLRRCDAFGDRCQRNSPQTKTFDVLHPVFKVVPKPWYLVGIDRIEAPTTSTKWNKYLLTQTDYFTKYVEAVPLPDKSAYSVAKGLYSTFCRHGAPVHVISDQGREFVNQVNQWCKSMKIHIFCRVLLLFFFSAHLCL